MDVPEKQLEIRFILITFATRKSQSLQSAVWVVMGPSVPAVLPTMIVVHLSISANDISDASTTAKIDSARLITDVSILDVDEFVFISLFSFDPRMNCGATSVK